METGDPPVLRTLSEAKGRVRFPEPQVVAAPAETTVEERPFKGRENRSTKMNKGGFSLRAYSVPHDIQFHDEPLSNGVHMKFARITFYIASIWGILVITPLYFLYDTIGRQDPPPITHPGFYYGFAGAALAWQFAFFIIARDPVRFRLMMLPSIFQKLSFAAAHCVLFLQHRTHPADLGLGGIEALFGLLFLIAFLKTSS